jgi:hypothetical protein
MATNSDVQRAKDATVPTLSILRNTIERRASRVREDVRGALVSTLRNITDAGDKQIADTHKKVRAQQWSEAGAELLKHEAVAEGTAMFSVLADATAAHHRTHRDQLDRELSQVPDPPNAFLASEVRQELRQWKRVNGICFSAAATICKW